MSIDTAERLRPATFRVSLPLWVAAAIYALLLALGGKLLLTDPDVYWHIATAEWIVEHRAFPHVDMFSWTMPGAPWIAKEWLSQLLYAGAHAVAGWGGVVVLAAAAIAASFALLAHFLLQKLAPLPALTLVGAGFVLAAPHLTARPHALALPLMVVWAGVLMNAVDHRRTPPLALVPVMTLWANLHGSFTLGLALVAPLAFEAWWSAGAARRETALRWLRFGALALLAACVTPYGAEPILVAWRMLGLGQILSLVNEWQPQNFGRIGGFEACLLLGLGFAVYRGIVLPPLRIVLLLGLLHLALSQSRHVDVLGLVAPLVLAQPLAAQVGSAEERADDPSAPSSGLASGALVACLAALTWAVAGTGLWAPLAHISPVGAVAAIKARNAGPVLNDYDYGGYLIYTGVRPFIDGRTDQLYGEAFLVRYYRAVTLQNVGDFVHLLDEYGIGATLLFPTTPAVGLLDRMDEWQRVYADDVAVVHVRRAAVR
jgi:hypothetical protein